MNDNKSIYWSPSIMWKILDNDDLCIQNYLFKGEYNKLFPKFYYLTQSGISLDNLVKEFSNFEEKKINKFIKKLMKFKILIDGIQEYDEIFYAQNKLFKEINSYDESVKFDAKKLEKFKEDTLTRQEKDIKNRIKLLANNNIPTDFKKRRSIREFDTSRKIAFEQFSDLLSMLSQRKVQNERRYFFPSAGGLYPIDYYIYVKDDRVEEVPEGLYIYSTVLNELQLISKPKDINEDVYYYLNKDIFKTSAFSIYFFYDTESSMPKYGSNGYYYAILDCGIVVEALAMQAEFLDLGCCSIGEMNIRSIQHNFNLYDRHKKYLHCLEFGLKK